MTEQPRFMVVLRDPKDEMEFYTRRAGADTPQDAVSLAQAITAHDMGYPGDPEDFTCVALITGFGMSAL